MNFAKLAELLVPLDRNLACMPISRHESTIYWPDVIARWASLRCSKKHTSGLSAPTRKTFGEARGSRHMVSQGEIEEAIKEYRALVKRAPQVRFPLAQLLIAWNRQRPASQRDWSEVKSLIDDAEKTSPESVDAAILRAALYEAQDKPAEARSELEKAQSRFPKSVAIWCARPASWGLRISLTKRRACWPRPKSNWEIALNCGSSEQGSC